MTAEPIDISIILPCLNEEKSIGACLEKIKKVIRDYTLDAEVIVVDNNSTDDTAKIVLACQRDFPRLRLVTEKKQGYGSAYLAGLKAARGNYFFMADADLSYDFADIPRFIEKLKGGYDLVVGNRFSGRMEKGSMPFLHRYIGNPVLSFLVRKFFNIKIGDIHSGERALSRKGFERLTLYTGGMEFASEMIIKAARNNLRITELGVSYKERVGESKLHPFRDGWRHLRFIFLYSPLYLFVIPGVILGATGILLMLIFYFMNVSALGMQTLIYPMFLFAIIIMIGYQLIFFGGFSKIYAITHLGDRDIFLEKVFAYITIEKAATLGVVITFFSSILCLYLFIHWTQSGYGTIEEIKRFVVALTFVILGIQTIFSSFMLSILGIKEK